MSNRSLKPIDTDIECHVQPEDLTLKEIASCLGQLVEHLGLSIVRQSRPFAYEEPVRLARKDYNGNVVQLLDSRTEAE